jgi:hypothetical protein
LGTPQGWDGVGILALADGALIIGSLVLLWQYQNAVDQAAVDLGAVKIPNRGRFDPFAGSEPGPIRELILALSAGRAPVRC